MQAVDADVEDLHYQKQKVALEIKKGLRINLL